MKPISLSHEVAEIYLAEGNWVHVFEDPGNREGLMWPRSKVLEHFKTCGAGVSGPGALALKHGLCTTADDGIVRYFQTRDAPP